MPNIKSAKKRLLTSAKQNERNKAVKSKIASTKNKLNVAIASKDKDQCKEVSKLYSSVLDKAVKKGVVKANTASRKKSRVAKKLAKV